MFFKVLWTKKPERIYRSIVDTDKEKIKEVDYTNLTKLSRRSWRVRVLRYSELLPEHLQSLDPNRPAFKAVLKTWVQENIGKDGDHIFKGKNRPEKTDWLALEVEKWRKQMDHERTSLYELQGIEAEDQ